MLPGSSAASTSGELDGPDADPPDWRTEPIIQTTAYDSDSEDARLAGDSPVSRGIADNGIGFHVRRGQEARR